MKYFVLVFISCLFLACNGDIWGREPANADFKMLNNECEAPCKVTFINTSTGNANTYNWLFGNVGSSTDENPEHIFNAPGDYDIFLSASNSGSFSSKMQKVRINEPKIKPVISFDILFNNGTTGENCLSPCSISIENKTMGIDAAYFWDFGNGNTSTDKNPQHSFGTDGTFIITLTATNQYGTSSLSKTLRVLPYFNKVKLRSLEMNTILSPFQSYDINEPYPNSCPDLYLAVHANNTGNWIIQNRDLSIQTNVQTVPYTLYNLHDVDLNTYGYYTLHIRDYDEHISAELDDFVFSLGLLPNTYTQFIQEVTYPDNSKHWIANVPLQQFSNHQGILVLEYIQ